MKKIKNPYYDLYDKGYNCFACCPENPAGLKMEFYEDGDDIVCIWTPGHNYQGWFNTLHGGIQATLMDEVAGWVVNRKLQLAGMTTNLNLKYKKPVPTGENEKIEIRAHLREQKRNFAIIDASITHNGVICSTCELTYYCFSKEKSEKDFYFTGCKLEEEL